MTKVIHGYIKTDMVGSKVKFELEFDDEEWDDMSWHEQDEAVFEHAMSHVEWTYEMLEANHRRAAQKPRDAAAMAEGGGDE